LGSHVVETEYGSIEYASIGNGYPVLVVHGNAGGFDQGLLLANYTIDPKFRLISVSRFGYLRSSMPANASVEMQADAYVSLLDSLNIKKVIVVAYSAGSASAVQFAIRHPDRVSALILVSPVGIGEQPIMPKTVFNIFFTNDFVYWATITFFGSSVQSQWAGLPNGFILTPKEKVEVNDLMVSILPVSARTKGAYFDTYISTPEMLNSSESKDYPYGDIKTPTLVISAVDDPLALHEDAVALANRIPNAQLFSVPDGGHLLLGHQEEVKLEITQFLHNNIPSLNDN
jgi:pimeloyl-ACP methyl ester carboxylesterase